MSEKLKNKAYEIIKSAINCLAEKDYEQLKNTILIDDSWKDEGQDNGIDYFTEWLDGQLQMWSEDSEKEMVIDPFNEKQVVPDEFSNGRVFYEYKPTSHGEELDFWFEIECTVNEKDEVKAVLNVNI